MRKVTMQDFEHALNEIKPVSKVNEVENSIRKEIMIEYGDIFNSLQKNCNEYIEKFKTSQN